MPQSITKTVIEIIEIHFAILFTPSLTSAKFSFSNSTLVIPRSGATRESLFFSVILRERSDRRICSIRFFTSFRMTFSSPLSFRGAKRRGNPFSTLSFWGNAVTEESVRWDSSLRSEWHSGHYGLPRATSRPRNDSCKARLCCGVYLPNNYSSAYFSRFICLRYWTTWMIALKLQATAHAIINARALVFASRFRW